MEYWQGCEDLIEKQVGRRAIRTFPDLPHTPYHALLRTAKRVPEKRAVVSERATAYSYRKLLALTDAFAWKLKRDFGVKKGDHVALMLYNTPEFFITYLALAKLGAVAVTLPTKFRQAEITSLLGKADVVCAVCEPEFLAWFSCQKLGFPEDSCASLEPGEPFAPEGGAEDPVILMFTSGTTSRSKGALLRNYNVMHAAEAYRRVTGVSERDRTLLGVPIYHITGISAVLGMFILVGGTVFLQKRVDAARLMEAVNENEITYLHISPSICYLLLEKTEKYPFAPSLRTIVSGSSNMPPQMIRDLHRWLPKMEFRPVYGLTETSSPGTIFPCDAADSKYIGSNGLPFPGLEIRIVDDSGNTLAPGEIGEVLIRGAAVLESYYRLESEAFLADGWFATGDLGYQTDTGYLYIVDRKKDMINRGGEKICSFDVENELHNLTGVAEAAVVGIPDPKYGEAPAAVIRMHRGQTLTQSAVCAALKSRLASYQIPVRVLFVDELPRTKGGKTDKNAIRELFCDQN